MESYIDRMKVEFYDLVERYGKLATFIYSGKASALPQKQEMLLRLQLQSMKDYIAILEKRLALAEDTDNNKSFYMPFSMAVNALKAGYAIRRENWQNKRQCIVKQIPALIGKDIIPNMQSLPDSMKDLLLSTTQFISYENQCLCVDLSTGSADNWVPTIADIFAMDWLILTTRE